MLRFIGKMSNEFTIDMLVMKVTFCFTHFKYNTLDTTYSLPYESTV